MDEHVVIAGGGVGALEGLLALRAHLGDGVRLSLVCPTRQLTYRALSVAEPFGAGAPQRYEWERITSKLGVRWISDLVTGVRAETRELETRDGPPVPYDALLLALGARAGSGLPGALSFTGPRDVLAVADAIEQLEPGRRYQIAFVAPGGVAWTLPLYELALMTAENGRRRGLDVQIKVVTRESAPLGVFGADASAAVAHRLSEAGIGLRTGTFATEVEEGKLWLELESPIDADLVVALPTLKGPCLAGVPSDADGFVPVDRLGRVQGTDLVWAVGDMTTRALKQGGLAAQQADVAAADIAAEVAGADIEVHPYEPELHGLLLTGGEPLFLERLPSTADPSHASATSPWSPPHKVVGRHLGPFLETLRAPAGI